MFKDYYGILEINEEASEDEIKAAYRRLAIKWHPDKNVGIDTTSRMQELNEAYVLLKDKEGRERYNREYQNLKRRVKPEPKGERSKGEQSPPQSKANPFEYPDYKFSDEVLRKWMDNAKRQAVDLAKQSIEDLKGMVVVGVKEGSKAILYQIAGVIIVIILFGIGRSCNENPQLEVHNLSKSDIWFNNMIRWVSIKTPTKFIRQEIDYQKGLPGYDEKINSIETYSFKSKGIGGMLLYMDTKFESYITEAGLRKSIENLSNTTSSYNLQLSCNEIDNVYDDTACSGTFDTDEFKGFVRGYCIWIDKKAYLITVFAEYNKENIVLVDSIFNSIKILK